MAHDDAIRLEISRVRESAGHREGPHDDIKEYVTARRSVRRGDPATRAEGHATRRERDPTARRAASRK